MHRPLATSLIALLSLACGDDGGGVSADAGEPDAELAPTPITVSGTVVHRHGGAVAGASIFIEGHSPVVTNGSGAFEIPDVTPPYDVLITDTTTGSGTLYVGLTTTEPWLNIHRELWREGFAPVDVTLTAGGSGFVSPNPADTRTVLRPASPGVAGFDQTLATEPATAMDFNLSWPGTAPRDETVNVIQYTSVDGYATDYLAFGGNNLDDVEDGSNDNTLNITMQPVDDDNITGSITVPEGQTLAVIRSRIMLFGAGSFLVNGAATTETTYSLLMPQVTGATGTVEVVATLPEPNAALEMTRTGLAIPSSGIDFELPDLPAPIAESPAADAAGVGPGSVLSWASGGDLVYVVQFWPDDGNSRSGRLTVVTQGGEATLPDTAPYGVTLGSAEEYAWSAVGHHGPGSVDDVAVSGYFQDFYHDRRDNVVVRAEERLATSP